MKRISLFLFFILSCTKTDYYSDIKKDCDHKRAKEYFERFSSKGDPNIFTVIDAMADCRSEEMERFLSEEYAKSSENIKGHIYKKLTRNKSRIFLDTVLGILINKIQTNQDYSTELNYIRETDPSFTEKRYNEYQLKLENARKNKNLTAIEIYSDNIRALSKVLNINSEDTKLKEDIAAIRSEKEREDLYQKFLDATMNQEMGRAYNIFKKLSANKHIRFNDKTAKLEEILRQISDTEEKFYETAHRQDMLMIEIEKEKRAKNENRVKKMQEKLQSVKSDMVFKKRALDRAAKKLEIVRELFEEVRIK